MMAYLFKGTGIDKVWVIFRPISRLFISEIQISTKMFKTTEKSAT